MRFTNRTPYPARFEAGSPGDAEMLGCVGCKVTYFVEGDRLVPAPEDESWPVFDKVFVHEGVRLGPDVDFRREGVNVIVFGRAMAPGGSAVPHVLVTIECGAVRHQVWAIGDRRWVKVRGGLMATDPEPFVEMPISNDRAFGGKASMDGMEAAHPANPDGRGFALSEEDAVGAFLPNLEWPDDRLMRWSDEPRPACFFKPSGFLDEPGAPPEGFPRRLMEAGFRQSVPSLIAATPDDLGDVLTLSGFDPAGTLAFPVPPRRGPVVHVAVGASRSRFPAALSSLVALVPERVVVATYLALFRYLFRPEEIRTAELRWEGHDRG